MNGTSPKLFAFVLMPFSAELEYEYEGIKSACEEAGVHAVKADEQIYDSTILQQIYNQISKADILIALMTSQNPNVFYETGYAHALGKHVILLSKNKADIPFDLRDYPIIIYNNFRVLRKELLEKVVWAKKNLGKASSKLKHPFEYFIDGIALGSKPTVEYNILNERKIQNFKLKVDIHNSNVTSTNRALCEIAFQMPRHLNASRDPLPDGKNYNVIRMPEEKNLFHFIGKAISIMPGGWNSVNIRFLQENKESPKFYKKNDVENIVLHSYSVAGKKEYPFNLKFV